MFLSSYGLKILCLYRAERRWGPHNLAHYLRIAIRTEQRYRFLDMGSKSHVPCNKIFQIRQSMRLTLTCLASIRKINLIEFLRLRLRPRLYSQFNRTI